MGIEITGGASSIIQKNKTVMALLGALKIEGAVDLVCLSVDAEKITLTMEIDVDCIDHIRPKIVKIIEKLRRIFSKAPYFINNFIFSPKWSC